jgi:hypothetical protein
MASKKSTAASLSLANKRLQAPARQRASLGRSLLELKSQSEALQAYQEYLEQLITEVSLLEHEAISHLEEVTEAESLHIHSSSGKSKPSNKIRHHNHESVPTATKLIELPIEKLI